MEFSYGIFETMFTACKYYLEKYFYPGTENLHQFDDCVDAGWKQPFMRARYAVPLTLLFSVAATTGLAAMKTKSPALGVAAGATMGIGLCRVFQHSADFVNHWIMKHVPEEKRPRADQTQAEPQSNLQSSSQPTSRAGPTLRPGI